MAEPKPPSTSPWPALARDLEALAARYAAAVGADEDDEDADVADGIASTLAILVEVADFATTRLELRALMHAAMGNVTLGELAARIEARKGRAST
jgi:hypothetical protein